MRSYFRLKLFMVMIVFAIVISFTIATTDHLKLREYMLNYNQLQVQQTEEGVQESLRTIEKAYSLFGNELAEKMESASEYLVNLYADNPNFAEWDFQQLKSELDLDIYIINEKNVITHSSFEDDIGLDFTKCCRKLVPKLDKIRDSGEIFIEGMDLEQQTGEIKKYSYLATPDKKYLLETGYSLQQSPIFKEFNFMETITKLVEKYPSINEINVLNIGGSALGEAIAPETKLPLARRTAFEQALTSNQTTELKGEWRDQPAIYRYVPYVSEIDTGTTKHKVLEIVYNDFELQAILNENKQTFILRLFIVLTITILLSFIIASWLAKPMYLAFHDSLTGLKNRAAFDETLATVLAERKGTTALLMIDLDNFKLVNDYLGHDQGDYLLQCVAQNINAIARKEDITFRWGGDEFMIIMSETSQEEAERVAQMIISSLQKICAQQVDLRGEEITVSIGISVAPEHGCDPETLSKHVDLALYASKEKGKNQYQVYTNEH